MAAGHPSSSPAPLACRVRDTGVSLPGYVFGPAGAFGSGMVMAITFTGPKGEIPARGRPVASRQTQAGHRRQAEVASRGPVLRSRSWEKT